MGLLYIQQMGGVSPKYPLEGVVKSLSIEAECPEWSLVAGK
jgi:hypothetical protein